VIAAAEGLTDFIERRLRQLSRQIHRDLSRKGDVGGTPFARHIRQANIEVFGHPPLNLVDRNRAARFFLENVLEQMLDDIVRQLFATQGSE